MKQFFLIVLPLFLLLSGCSKEVVNQAEVDMELIETYLADNQLNAQQHPSGMYYIIDEPGNGGSPNANSEVLVNYKGYLLDGTVFDETKGSPRTFFLFQVIEGWQIGIPLLKKGGKGRFFIPSQMAYGRNPRPGIPANSVLIFETELLNFQ